MAKATKKKHTKKKSTGSKGFGSVTTKSSSQQQQVELDRSKEACAFYDYMESQYAADNLSRCVLGYFPLGGNDSNMRLHGVMALKPIKKGDPIIRIP
jgi:hypothetical protein